MLVMVRNLCFFGLAITVTFFSNYLPEATKLLIIPFYLCLEAIRISISYSHQRRHILIPEVAFILLVVVSIFVLCLNVPKVEPVLLLIFMYLGLALKVVLIIMRWKGI